MQNNLYLNKVEFKNNIIKNYNKIIDVRSEDEYYEDNIPTSINIPVLKNEQRHIVGELYTRNIFEARKLGAQLISNNISNFLKKEKIKKIDKILLYCWRGGLRSLSMYLVLKNIGFNVHILNKGYKSYRSFINNFFKNEVLKYNFNILSGLTGTGKTFFLEKLSKSLNVLNLEYIANHKGSVLGNIPKKVQPSQKKFESILWYELLKLGNEKNIWTESESNKIGKLSIPRNLFIKMIKGRILNLEVPINKRAKFILQDYRYFTKEPKPVFQTFNILKKFLTKKKMLEINLNLKTKNYEKFVLNLLEFHYDKVYKKRKYFTEENIIERLSLNSINYKSSLLLSEYIKKHPVFKK